ncbi:MAG: gas vesicle protein GvpG [Candidatus Rokubacteria bacterium]|nr:gas vesicle protein GvpG [Candidatus Rokubacteria bacterium]
MLLIDDLLALPFRGFLGVFRKIQEMVDRELTDEGYIQEQLLEIQLRYEMDEIGEAEYAQQAAEWEAKLNAVRQAEEEAGSMADESAPGSGVTAGVDAVAEKPRAA